MGRSKSKLVTGWRFACGERPGEEDFREVQLPHDYAAERGIRRDVPEGEAQGFYDRWQILHYKRNLQIARKPHHRYFLHFDGACENSRVYVNGRYAGGHGFGCTPFTLEITDLVQDGDNGLLVTLDCTRENANRWYTGAGLCREVSLVETPEQYLSWNRVMVTCSLTEEGARVQVAAQYPDTPLACTLKGHGICLEKKEEKTGIFSFFVSSPHLWSAEEPSLYELILSRGEGEGSDEIRRKIGIRVVQTDPETGLFVNGKRTVLKGVCVHQDLGIPGNAFYQNLWRERLCLLKKMGVNAIRAAHQVFPEGFYDLCDELGFYVYEECFDKWTDRSYWRYFSDWKEDLGAMILRDRNRPCTLFWGVGNEVENQGQDSMLAILKQMTEYARSLDPTRPVSVALNPHFKRASGKNARDVQDIQQFVDEPDAFEITDPEEKVERIQKISRYVDILCLNYQEPLYEKIHAAVPDRMILGTEAYQYFRGSLRNLKNFSEDPPVLAPAEHPYDAGCFVWSGFDYLGESMGWPSRGWTGSPIRTDGEKRENAYLLESIWSSRPLVRFMVLDETVPPENTKEMWDAPAYFHHWSFPEGRRIVPCRIATNCSSVRLFLNGEEIRLPAPDPDRIGGHVLSFFLPWTPGTVEVQGIRDGMVVCRDLVRTEGAGEALAFENTEVSAREGEPVLLKIRALDSAGTPVFHENRTVRFHTEGGVRILGTDNGDMNQWTPMGADRIPLYLGQAAVLVRLPWGMDGIGTVTAEADGMTGAQLKIRRQSDEV